MKNFLLTCFLALLCLVGRYLAASDKVADSPGAELLHRSDSPHRGGAILPDTFPRIDFGLISSDQDMRVGMEKEHFHSTSVPVFFSQNKQEVNRKAPESQSLGSWFSSLASKKGLVDSDQDMGAGEEGVILQPAPVTVLAPLDSYISNPPNQFSLELSGDEASVIQHRSSDTGHLTTLPSSPARRSGVSTCPSWRGLLSLRNETALLRTSARSDASPQPSSSLPDSLTIGDQIPSGIEFNSFLNYDGESIRLDDFKGKYLILQFWAPTCTASIGSLPVMDAFQRKFGKDLTILPISVFREDRISATLRGNAALESLELPFVTNAQQMRSYFPHTVIPHVVIIDPEGQIIAITGIEDVTEQNIEQLLADGKSLFRKKSDTRITLPANERLIAEAPQVKNKNLWFQSALTGYIPEVNGSLNQQFKEMSHIRIINMPLLYHYSLAFSEQNKEDYYGFNRIDTIGFDPEEIWSDKVGRDYEDWMAEGTHVFGYELIAPLHANPYQLMQVDLKRFLPHIEVSVERKTKMVFALVQQEGKTYPPSAGGERAYKASSGVQMSNYPLQGFVHHLNVVFQRNSPDPFINLTGIDYPIDLTLIANLSNVESLRKALRENGLDLIHREEDINVLVLRKISEPNYLSP